ncbi:MAG: hypothetical protein ACE5KE_06755, partial [Methanosarcinales archaeon]
MEKYELENMMKDVVKPLIQEGQKSLKQAEEHGVISKMRWSKNIGDEIRNYLEKGLIVKAENTLRDSMRKVLSEYKDGLLSAKEVENIFRSLHYRFIDEDMKLSRELIYILQRPELEHQYIES